MASDPREPHLCIGGPADGQWMRSDSPQFKTPALDDIDMAITGRSISDPAAVNPVNVTYTLRQWRTGTGVSTKDSFVWLPDGLDEHAAFCKLLAGYRP